MVNSYEIVMYFLIPHTFSQFINSSTNTNTNMPYIRKRPIPNKKRYQPVRRCKYTPRDMMKPEHEDSDVESNASEVSNASDISNDISNISNISNDSKPLRIITRFKKPEEPASKLYNIMFTIGQEEATQLSRVLKLSMQTEQKLFRDIRHGTYHSLSGRRNVGLLKTSGTLRTYFDLKRIMGEAISKIIMSPNTIRAIHLAPVKKM